MLKLLAFAAGVFLISCQSSPHKNASVKINEVIKNYQPEIMSCWESYLERNKHTKHGKVMSEWVIHKDGTVHDVKIKENDLEKDSVFEECLVSTLQKLKFTDYYVPKGNEAVVTFPFQFSVKN